MQLPLQLRHRPDHRRSLPQPAELEVELVLAGRRGQRDELVAAELFAQVGDDLTSEPAMLAAGFDDHVDEHRVVAAVVHGPAEGDQFAAVMDEDHVAALFEGAAYQFRVAMPPADFEEQGGHRGPIDMLRAVALFHRRPALLRLNGRAGN